MDTAALVAANDDDAIFDLGKDQRAPFPLLRTAIVIDSVNSAGFSPVPCAAKRGLAVCNLRSQIRVVQVEGVPHLATHMMYTHDGSPKVGARLGPTTMSSNSRAGPAWKQFNYQQIGSSIPYYNDSTLRVRVEDQLEKVRQWPKAVKIGGAYRRSDAQHGHNRSLNRT